MWVSIQEIDKVLDQQDDFLMSLRPRQTELILAAPFYMPHLGGYVLDAILLFRKETKDELPIFESPPDKSFVKKYISFWVYTKIATHRGSPGSW